MALEIEATGEGLRLRGEVDLSTAEALLDALRELIHAGGPLIVDLSGITFMDSTGVKALISATHHLEPEDELVLRSPTLPLQRLFDLTRLAHVPGIRVEGGT
jgi:anti-anti-sigma factor